MFKLSMVFFTLVADSEELEQLRADEKAIRAKINSGASSDEVSKLEHELDVIRSRKIKIINRS